MAPSMTASVRSNHEVFQIISGRSAVKAPSLIAEELTNHRPLLLDGLLYYKAHSKEAEARLQEEKALSKLEAQFLVQLSRFLDLDAVQCKELFEAYILNAFRGTGAQLQSILKDERSVQALLQKVWEYYHTERMMLLHCLKHLLSFHRDTDHLYQAQYLQCVLKLEDEKVLEALMRQYEASFNAPAPTKQKRGPLMSERHSVQWCLQGLAEQCELLEIILLFVRDQNDPTKNLLRLAQLFQKQGFGTRQPYRYLLDAEVLAHQLTGRIGFLCSLLLIECMDLYLIDVTATADAASDHSLGPDTKLAQELAGIFQNLGGSAPHGPVLLAWLVLSTTLWPGDDSVVGVRKLGQQAIQLQVFRYLAGQLESLPDTQKSIVSLTQHIIVYTLLTLVLTLFHEDTLGGRQDLIQLACQLLKQRQLCQEFWARDASSGLVSLLHSAAGRFPLDFNSLLKLLTPLTTEGSRQVFEYVVHLPTFTEPLDDNRSGDLHCTNQRGVWKLTKDKVVLPAGDKCHGFTIPAGTLGCQLQGDNGDLIRWDVDFSGWNLFHCLTNCLLVRIRQGSVPSGVQVGQAAAIVDLVTSILEADWSLSARLRPITDCVYLLISSLSSLVSPPVTLLSVCIKCVTVLAGHQPDEAWHSLQGTGFLPHTGDVYSDLSRAVSGEGMYPADYGKLLANQEQPAGQYPVTLQVLRLVEVLLEGLGATDVELAATSQDLATTSQDLATSQDLVACVMFVQKNIFASYHTWRYARVEDREEIGQRCLNIFHVVLHAHQAVVKPKVAASKSLNAKKSNQVNSVVSVHEACVHGFLHTSAGEALLSIIASGIDTLEQRIINQGSTFDGPAEKLSQLIKMSLSVMNRLLLRLLTPRGATPCPLEHALTSHTTGLPHQPHLIGLIASYVYHRHDPGLPTLATLLLKRVALVAPMSVFGCLGSQASAIRDIYLSRLQSHAEDERLKVVILELLTVAVETQPGLSELFLNLQEVKPAVDERTKLSKPTVGSTAVKFEIGKVSCLHAVLETIEQVKQGTTHCPPDLHCAAVGFLQALWQDARDTALSVLRGRPKFWSDVTAPLFNDLPTGATTQGIASQMKIRAYAFKILALECYSIPNDGLEAGYKTILKKLNAENRYSYWSKYIRGLLESEASRPTDVDEYLVREHEMLVLIQAWRTFLLVAASPNGRVFELTDAKSQSAILSDIAISIVCQSSLLVSVLNQKACSMLAGLYTCLLTHWTSSHINQWKHINSLVAALERLTDSESPGLNHTATAIMSALTTLLRQRTSKQVLDIESVESLLPIISLALQQSSRFYLTGPERSLDRGLDQGSALVDLPPRTSQDPLRGGGRDVNGLEKELGGVAQPSKMKYSLPTVSAYLLTELLMGERARPAAWLPLLRQHGTFSILLTTLQSCIQTKQGMHYAEAVLLLLLDLASIPQAAECIQTSGLIQQVCLPLLNLHRPQDGAAPGQTWANAAKTEKADVLTWPSIYREAVTVVTVMLGTLKHSFLEDALDFFGVHRERMIQCLQAVQYTQSRPCLMEAETTSAFVYQLSLFAQSLGSRMPTQEVHGLLGVTASMCHCCVALLVRPRLLQYLNDKSDKKVSRQQHVTLALGSTPTRLHHQQSMSTADTTDCKTSPAVVHIQARLLVLLGHGLAALRHFSPDLLTILLNPSVDILEYPMLFGIGFSTPSLDQEIHPSFGLLISCINTCVQLMIKLDADGRTAVSPGDNPPTILPVTGPSAPVQHRYMDRSVIMFVLEIAVELVMVQGLRCLKDPSLPLRDRQILKRELATELGTFLHALQRYFRRGGGPTSPSSASPSASSAMLRAPSLSTSSTSVLGKSTSHMMFSEVPEQAFFRIVQHFLQQILR